MRLTLRQLFVSAAVALMLLLYFFIDARKGGLPPCPFWSFTNLYCPGCGSQRALSSILHGNLRHALQNNLLLVISIPILIYLACKNLQTGGTQKHQLLYAPRTPKIILIVVLVFWLLRNIPIHPFSLMAPIAVE